MRVANRMTDKRLKALTADASCGIVPGLYVGVRKLKDGTYARYFLLRDRGLKRVFTLGKYPEMSLAEAFEKGLRWRKLIAEGIDPSEQEKASRDALRTSKRGGRTNL